jgi:hypothetical protein
MKIWFMFDNHTFAPPITTFERETMINSAIAMFAQDGCGSLFVKDIYGGGLENLTLNGHMLDNGRYGILREEIERWVDAVLTELSFQKAMVA